LRRGQELHVDFVLPAITNDGVIPAGSVFGAIRDSAGHPVASTSVVLRGLSRGTITDSLGHYHFDSVPAGPVLLLVRRVGYRGVQKDTVVAAGQQLWMDFVVRTETFRLAPVGWDNQSVSRVPAQR